MIKKVNSLVRFHVLGGGPAGCALGYFLSINGFEAVLYEASDVFGGMSKTVRVEDGSYVDCGPHVFHTPDREIEEVWKDIAGSELIENEFFSYVIKGKEYNRRYSYPISIEGLREAGLEDLAKEVRVGVTGQDSLATNYRDYMKGRVGDRVEQLFYRDYPEKLWGRSTDKLRADWAPKRVEVRERKEHFFDGQYCSTHRRGAGLFYEALIEKSEHLKAKRKHRVEEVVVENGRISEIRGEGWNELIEKDDIVISTLPATILAKMLDTEIDLKYRGVIVLCVGYDETIRLPDGAGWLYFDDKDIPFTRVTDHSLMSPDSGARDTHILTLEIPFGPAEIGKEDLEKILETSLSRLVEIEFLPSYKPRILKVFIEPFVYPMRDFGFEAEYERVESRVCRICNLYAMGASSEYVYGDSQIVFRKAKDFVEDIKSDLERGEGKVLKQFTQGKQRNSDAWEELISGVKLSRPVFISEIGLNHNGNMDLAKKLIEESHRAGADSVKLQLYGKESRASKDSRDAFYAEKSDGEGENLSDFLERVRFDISQIRELKKYADGIGIPLFVSAFDRSSLREAASLCSDVVKISSMDLTNYEIWDLAPRLFGTIIASTGMSTLAEVRRSVSHAKSIGQSRVALLHCVSSYPLNIIDARLGTIQSLKSICDEVGFSDHTMTSALLYMAVGLGARVIEKHVTLDKRLEGPDHIHSLDIQEVSELMKVLRGYDEIMTSRDSSVLACELKTLRLQKKSCFYKAAKRAGEKLAEEDIAVRAPGVGMDSYDGYKLVGKRLTHAVAEGSFIRESDFEK